MQTSEKIASMVVQFPFLTDITWELDPDDIGEIVVRKTDRDFLLAPTAVGSMVWFFDETGRCVSPVRSGIPPVCEAYIGTRDWQYKKRGELRTVDEALAEIGDRGEGRRIKWVVRTEKGYDPNSPELARIEVRDMWKWREDTTRSAVD